MHADYGNGVLGQSTIMDNLEDNSDGDGTSVDAGAGVGGGW